MNTTAYESAIRQAGAIGREHGDAAASWIEIDETNAARLLQGIEDGDPEVLDALPYADLSGQWADGYVPRDLLRDCGIEDADDGIADDLCTAYEQAFGQAVQDVAIERANYHLGN